MVQISRIGMDTSKQYFQLHGVNGSEEPILRKKLRRSEMVTFFEKLPATVVAIPVSPYFRTFAAARFYVCFAPNYGDSGLLRLY